MFAGDGKIIGFDGVFALAHGDSSTNWENWDELKPEQVRTAVEACDWNRRATLALSHGESAPPAPKSAGIYHSATQLDSREPGGPAVSLLTRDQSAAWFFKTREGAMGVLQIENFTGGRAAKIRYKLIQKPESNSATASTEVLEDRLAAASAISDESQKSQALSLVAIDAAKAGRYQIVEDAIRQNLRLLKAISDRS